MYIYICIFHTRHCIAWDENISKCCSVATYWPMVNMQRRCRKLGSEEKNLQQLNETLAFFTRTPLHYFRQVTWVKSAAGYRRPNFCVRSPSCFSYNLLRCQIVSSTFRIDSLRHRHPSWPCTMRWMEGKWKGPALCQKQTLYLHQPDINGMTWPRVERCMKQGQNSQAVFNRLQH